jgi:hypothetical protein
VPSTFSIGWGLDKERHRDHDNQPSMLSLIVQMGREDFNMKSHSLRPIMSIPSSVLLSLYYDSPDLLDLDLLKADEWTIAYGLRRCLR